jgi:hypothetical protein
VSDRIADLWGMRTPFGRGVARHRVDLILEEGVVEQDVNRWWSQTASMLHSNGDTRDVAVKNGRVVGLAFTDAVLLLLRSSHPPVGATTQIVSLGFLQTPPEMAAQMAGVVLLTVVEWFINRDSGVLVPVWGATG